MSKLFGDTVIDTPKQSRAIVGGRVNVTKRNGTTLTKEDLPTSLVTALRMNPTTEYRVIDDLDNGSDFIKHTEHDGIQGLLDWIVDTKATHDIDRSNEEISSHESGNVEFKGTANFQAAMDMLTDGSEEIIKNLKTVLGRESNDAIDVEGHDYQLTPAGGQIDIGKYVSGEPYCFVEPSTYEWEKPVAMINLVLSYNGGTEAKLIIENGAKILTAIQHLEASGVSVGLQGIFAATRDTPEGNGKVVSVQTVMLKLPTMPLSLKTLSAALHPSFFRRLNWLVAEAIDLTHERDYGYGRALWDKSGAFLHIADIVDATHVIDYVKDDVLIKTKDL